MLDVCAFAHGCILPGVAAFDIQNTVCGQALTMLLPRVGASNAAPFRQLCHHVLEKQSGL